MPFSIKFSGVPQKISALQFSVLKYITKRKSVFPSVYKFSPWCAMLQWTCSCFFNPKTFPSTHKTQTQTSLLKIIKNQPYSESTKNFSFRITKTLEIFSNKKLPKISPGPLNCSFESSDENVLLKKHNFLARSPRNK